jgi:methyl coenzyme M reductase subunit C
MSESNPKKIGPFDIFKVNLHDYSKVFKSELKKYFVWKDRKILNKWEIFFSFLGVTILVICILIASFYLLT